MRMPEAVTLLIALSLLVLVFEVAYLSRGGLQYLVLYMAGSAAACGLVASYYAAAGLCVAAALLLQGLAMYGLRRYIDGGEEDAEELGQPGRRL